MSAVKITCSCWPHNRSQMAKSMMRVQPQRLCCASEASSWIRLARGALGGQKCPRLAQQIGSIQHHDEEEAQWRALQARPRPRTFFLQVIRLSWLEGCEAYRWVHLQVKRVRCESSGVLVAKDKAIKRFLVRNIVDASAIRDLQDSSVIEGKPLFTKSVSTQSWLGSRV